MLIAGIKNQVSIISISVPGHWVMSIWLASSLVSSFKENIVTRALGIGRNEVQYSKNIKYGTFAN